ncbi:MAG: FeoB-associated Cys-rich membrane protein [Thermoguttaceae bacterium]
MDFDWQNLVALTLVLVAAVYLVRCLWRRSGTKNSGCCASCAGCSAAHQSEQQLLTLQPLSNQRKWKRGL